MFAFSWAFFFSTIPLISIRLFASKDDVKHMFNQSRRRLLNKIIFKFYLLSHQNVLFYTLLAIPIYILVGMFCLLKEKKNNLKIILILFSSILNNQVHGFWHS